MQQMSMGDLAVDSTAIIREQVTSSYTSVSGAAIYTHYRITVTETWKGPAAATVDVALPGGVANGLRQTFPGVPQLTSGVDYVLYLWTSPQSGITLPTGFSQGIFTVAASPSSGPMTSRPAISEAMLDSTGHPVHDQGVSMLLSDMKNQVAAAMARQANGK